MMVEATCWVVRPVSYMNSRPLLPISRRLMLVRSNILCCRKQPVNYQHQNTPDLHTSAEVSWGHIGTSNSHSGGSNLEMNSMVQKLYGGFRSTLISTTMLIRKYYVYRQQTRRAMCLSGVLPVKPCPAVHIFLHYLIFGKKSYWT